VRKLHREHALGVLREAGAGRSRRVAQLLGSKAAEPQRPESRRRAEALGERVDDRRHGIGERPALHRLGQGRDRVSELAPVAQRERFDDRLLVREEAVDRGDRHAGNRGDARRRQRARTLVGEHLLGRLEHPLKPLAAARLDRGVAEGRCHRANKGS
jgi:hypothetical protein